MANHLLQFSDVGSVSVYFVKPTIWHVEVKKQPGLSFSQAFILYSCCLYCNTMNAFQEKKVCALILKWLLHLILLCDGRFFNATLLPTTMVRRHIIQACLFSAHQPFLGCYYQWQNVLMPYLHLVGQQFIQTWLDTWSMITHYAAKNITISFTGPVAHTWSSTPLPLEWGWVRHHCSTEQFMAFYMIQYSFTL